MTGSPPLSHSGLHSQPDLVSYHACGAAVIWVQVLCTWCCVRHANLRPSKSKWKSKQTQKRMRHGVGGSCCCEARQGKQPGQPSRYTHNSGNLNDDGWDGDGIFRPEPSGVRGRSCIASGPLSFFSMLSVTSQASLPYMALLPTCRSLVVTMYSQLLPTYSSRLTSLTPFPPWCCGCRCCIGMLSHESLPDLTRARVPKLSWSSAGHGDGGQ